MRICQVFYNKRSENLLPHAVAYITWTLVAAAVVSPLFYEYPDWPASYVVTREDARTVTPHHFGAFVWEYGYGYANIPLGEHVLKGSVTILQNDSRIRTINYAVAVRVADPATFLHRYPKLKKQVSSVWEKTGQISKPFRSTSLPRAWESKCTSQRRKVSCNLTARGHGTLQEFDDPYNPDQQSQFKRLLESALGPKLEAYGLAIECKQFTLE